jgi:hypothetical protein
LRPPLLRPDLREEPAADVDPALRAPAPLRPRAATAPSDPFCRFAVLPALPPLLRSRFPPPPGVNEPPRSAAVLGPLPLGRRLPSGPLPPSPELSEIALVPASAAVGLGVSPEPADWPPPWPELAAALARAAAAHAAHSSRHKHDFQTACLGPQVGYNAVMHAH